MQKLQEHIVLLHGIFRTSRHMRKLANYLTDSGYTVHNLDYPSTQFNLAELSTIIINKINNQIPADVRLHFVGYSMGGLLLRIILNTYRPAKLGRVIQLAAPNQGSEVADFVKNFSLYKKLYGPAGQQLVTDQTHIRELFGTIDYELGIIAGDLCIDPFSALLIRKPSDGKVSLESSKLENMQAYTIIHACHTFFPANQQVLAKTLQFLRSGTL